MSVLKLLADDLQRGFQTNDLRSVWERHATFSGPRHVSAVELKQRERQRKCMARLRAERKGKPLDGLQPMVRKGQGARFLKRKKA